MDRSRFLLAYLIVMLLVYLWRGLMFAGMMWLVVCCSSWLPTHGLLPNLAALILPLLLYLCLIWIAYKRSTATGRTYLIAFPILAGLFDVVVPFIPLVPPIPLVPSFMHLAALVVGFQPKRQT